jgi:nucleoside-diphosphate-sugar epimerase
MSPKVSGGQAGRGDVSACYAEMYGLAPICLALALQSVAADRSDELHAIALNATKAEKELEWKPTVALAEGIQRTIQLAVRHS